jgi:hypothetical protein
MSQSSVKQGLFSKEVSSNLPLERQINHPAVEDVLLDHPLLIVHIRIRKLRKV